MSPQGPSRTTLASCVLAATLSLAPSIQLATAQELFRDSGDAPLTPERAELDGLSLLCQDPAGDCYPHSLESTVLRLFVWVVADTNGVRGLTTPRTETLLDQLEATYATIGIDLEEVGRATLEDDSLYSFISAPENRMLTLMNSGFFSSHRDAVNAVLLPEDSNQGQTGRFYDRLDLSVFHMGGRDYVTTPSASHEMGHVLGLWHTFDYQRYGRDTLPDSTGQDPTDCRQYGDLICDTPEDPDDESSCYMPLIDDTCSYSVTAEQFECLGSIPPAGLQILIDQFDGYNPATDNIMSYYFLPRHIADALAPCGPYGFTTFQIDKMYAALERLTVLQQARADLLLAPVGGEVFYVSEPVDIVWRNDHRLADFEAVDLVYLPDGGPGESPIATGIPNSGSFEWVPDESQVSTAGVVRVDYKQANKPSIVPYSSSGAIVIRPIAEAVNFPNDGDPVFVGENVEIRWTQANSVRGPELILDTVDITVERQADQTNVYTIAGVTNTGSHVGWIPQAEDAGQDFVVKLVFHNTISSQTGQDESDAPFGVENIEDRVESITAPNDAGTVVFPGAAYPITWTTANSWRGADHVVDLADVELLLDGGSTVVPLAMATPNDGVFEWTPSIDQSSADARVQITLHNVINESTVTDASDDAFVIGGYRFQYENLSAYTGLDYLGNPYSAVAFDYNNDALLDLMVTIREGGNSEFYQGDHIAASGAPAFVPMRDVAFPNPADRPQAGLRGMAVDDFDAANGPDVFAAAETGARLYQNDGDDGQGQYTFSDVSASLGLHANGALDGSWSGTWHDYNGGGPDLFVGRATLPQGQLPGDDPDPATLLPATPVLFRNDGGTFTNVSISSGIELPADEGVAALSASWVRVDSDSHADLVVGDFRNQGEAASRIYIYDPMTETFSLENTRFATVPTAVSGIAAADMDGDGDFDLAVAHQSAGPPVDEPQVYFNDGAGNYSTIVELTTGISALGLVVYNQDANGTPDILILPSSATDSPRLFSNFSTSTNPLFLERTAAVGLTGVGRVDGAVANDFDGDGKIDLYLGRPTSSSAYYYRAKKYLPADPDLPHFAVQLEGGGAGNPESGMGAVVLVNYNGQPWQSQVVGASMGRGGQTPLALTFGVLDESGNYEAEVHWPEGYIQVEPIVLNQLNTISDATNPTVDTASMAASYTPAPGTTSTWTFEWDCAFQSIAGLDRVIVTAPGGCLSSQITLTPNQPNVTVTCSPNPSGGVHHTMVATGMDCIPSCTYTWHCESSTTFVTSSTSSTPKTFKTKICVQ